MSDRSTILPRCVSLGVAAISLAVAAFAFDLVRQDVLLNQVRAQLTFWQDESYVASPEAIRAVSDRLALLSDGILVHPDVMALEANYLSWRRYWAALDPGAQSADGAGPQALARSAIQLQYTALAARPAHIESAELLRIYTNESRTILIEGNTEDLLGAELAADRTLAGLLRIKGASTLNDG